MIKKVQIEEKTKKKIDNLFHIAIFIIYIIITFIIVNNHEAYEDEAQSWLIARDMNFIDIIKQMQYEGHSFLWYFIIAPFAKIGLPIQVQSYISWAFCIAAVYIILNKSPFHKMSKLLLVFSSGLLYFYSAIARPYCMIPLLLALLAMRYQNKKQHPYQYAILIGLLANTHLIMMPMAGMLVIDFWGKELIFNRKNHTKEEKRKLYISLLMVSLAIIIYLVIAIIALKQCKILTYQDKTGLITNASNFFELIKHTINNIIGFFYGNKTVPAYYAYICIGVIGLCALASKHNIKQSAMFWVQLLFIILLHTLAWFLLMPRVCVIIYMLMFWVWNQKLEDKQKGTKKGIMNKIPEIALCILIAINIPATIQIAYQDVQGNFSTGKMVAEYIEENIQEPCSFICLNNELQQSIIAYLPKDKYTFYTVNAEREFTYITWDDKWLQPMTVERVEQGMQYLKDKGKPIYILQINGEILRYENELGIQTKKIMDSKNNMINSLYTRVETFEIFEIIEQK